MDTHFFCSDITALNSITHYIARFVLEVAEIAKDSRKPSKRGIVTICGGLILVLILSIGLILYTRKKTKTAWRQLAAGVAMVMVMKK